MHGKWKDTGLMKRRDLMILESVKVRPKPSHHHCRVLTRRPKFHHVKSFHYFEKESDEIPEETKLGPLVAKNAY